MTDKTITGVPHPRWWQRHPTLAFCAVWAGGLGLLAAVLVVAFQAAT
ncbi:hypothetical protein [Caulobacter hibisci]|uniref:Uncharacterized protein n=1 Tax=Caulobacter hibisci TaxID=2035993 RepID=A0ABS0SU81_9CAUL|nr:hypothetical protein [Caulobacter hibisci]MBI1682949.1 hypothetical protein [Caulobacter hibisci]